MLLAVGIPPKEEESLKDFYKVHVPTPKELGAWATSKSTWFGSFDYVWLCMPVWWVPGGLHVGRREGLFFGQKLNRPGGEARTALALGGSAT